MKTFSTIKSTKPDSLSGSPQSISFVNSAAGTNESKIAAFPGGQEEISRSQSPASKSSYFTGDY